MEIVIFILAVINIGLGLILSTLLDILKELKKLNKDKNDTK